MYTNFSCFFVHGASKHSTHKTSISCINQIKNKIELREGSLMSILLSQIAFPFAKLLQCGVYVCDNAITHDQWVLGCTQWIVQRHPSLAYWAVCNGI